MSVLSEILADKRTEIDCARRRVSLGELQRRVERMPKTRDFAGALLGARRPALIAEIKKASPSKGVIRYDFDPVALARSLEGSGATCLSVLTDERHFHGKLEYLAQVREVVAIPLLRKDFIIDEYQLFEARAAGADAVLLITAALKATELLRLVATARAIGLQTIVEVHDGDELDEALRTPARMIGVNNRDLHRFRTSLATTLELAPRIPPDRVVISESGVNDRSDVVKLGEAGVHAILVGESIMRSADTASKVRELLAME